jgi:hypothetical protein
MSSHRSYLSARRIVEKTLLYHVDILVPEDGLGQRLNEMHAWCGENVERGAWAQHGYREPLRDGLVPRDYARFCFIDGARAEAFRQQWSE